MGIHFTISNQNSANLQCLDTEATEKTSSQGRSTSPEDPKHEEIPDGGLLAWTQVVMGHLVIFNCWGYITS